MRARLGAYLKGNASLQIVRSEGIEGVAWAKGGGYGVNRTPVDATGRKTTLKLAVKIVSGVFSAARLGQRRTPFRFATPRDYEGTRAFSSFSSSSSFFFSFSLIFFCRKIPKALPFIKRAQFRSTRLTLRSRYAGKGRERPRGSCRINVDEIPPFSFSLSLTRESTRVIPRNRVFFTAACAA